MCIFTRFQTSTYIHNIVTEAFLLHVLENGDNLHEKLTELYIQDITSFENSFEKQKIHIFTDNAKYTVTSADKFSQNG